MSDDAPVTDQDRDRVEVYAMTVGEVWREARVSCPHRDLLRAWREGGIKGGAAEYLDFHVSQAKCPYCQANLDDFDRDDAAATSQDLEGLRDRLLSSTMSILREKQKDD